MTGTGGDSGVPNGYAREHRNAQIGTSSSSEGSTGEVTEAPEIVGAGADSHRPASICTSSPGRIRTYPTHNRGCVVFTPERVATPPITGFLRSTPVVGELYTGGAEWPNTAPILHPSAPVPFLNALGIATKTFHVLSGPSSPSLRREVLPRVTHQLSREDDRYEVNAVHQADRVIDEAHMPARRPPFLRTGV